MIVAALVTPLWRRVMDPRVIAHYDGDLTRANLHPPALRRLRARYPQQRDAPSTTAPSLGSV